MMAVCSERIVQKGGEILKVEVSGAIPRLSLSAPGQCHRHGTSGFGLLLFQTLLPG